MEDEDAAASSVMAGMMESLVSRGVVDSVSCERRGVRMLVKWEGACQKPSWSWVEGGLEGGEEGFTEG